MRAIRWGILGLGNIAEKFAADLKLVPHCVLQAVASQRSDHAKAFAERHQAISYYDSYVALLEDLEVDVIYIATLHPAHAQWSILCLQHKKAVLCEKPLAMNGGEVEKMIQTANQHSVFLMEALWTRFNPLFEQLISWIAAGKIGTIRYIQASFSFYALDWASDSRVKDPKKGGGALLDIGIYPLFLAYQILGMPSSIHAQSILSDQGIDLQTAMLLNYEKAQAVLYSGLTHNEDMGAKICGEKGEIYLPSRWHETNKATFVSGDEEESLTLTFDGKGYFYEIVETNNCLRKGVLQSEKWSHKDSVNLMTLLDRVRQKAGIHYAEE